MLDRNFVRGTCDLFDLGMVGYRVGSHLQQRLQRARINGDIGDTILLLQHQPVITLGRSGNKDNIIVSEEFLRDAGIQVVHSNRGGDVTFHNPGQLVAYFILDLEEMMLSVHRCVRALEESVIRLLSRFGITAARDPEHPGVWVGDDKICALGMNVSKGVSTHGFALNVTNDLTLASYIHPCGIRDKGVISMSGILSHPVTIAELAFPLIEVFEAVFHVDIHYRAAGGGAPSPMG